MQGNFLSNQRVVIGKQHHRNPHHWFGEKKIVSSALPNFLVDMYIRKGSPNLSILEIQKVEELRVQLGAGIGLFQNLEFNQVDPPYTDPN